MGIARNRNARWLDVLENGTDRALGDVIFDIDWAPAEGGAGRQGPAADPGRPVRRGARLRAAEAELSTSAASAFATTTPCCRWRRARSRAILGHRLDRAQRATRRRAPELRELKSLIAWFTTIPSDADTGVERLAGAAGADRARPTRLLGCSTPRRPCAEFVDGQRAPLQRHARRSAELRPARRPARPIRPTAWRTGASPARRSTTGASSTSTSWPPSAWRSPRSSQRPTALRLPAGRARASSPACASITPTGSTHPASTSAGCRRAAPARWAAGATTTFYVVAEKILAPGEHLPEGWADRRHHRLRVPEPGQRHLRGPQPGPGAWSRCTRALIRLRPPFARDRGRVQAAHRWRPRWRPRSNMLGPSSRPDLREAPLSRDFTLGSLTTRAARDHRRLSGLSHLRRRAAATAIRAAESASRRSAARRDPQDRSHRAAVTAARRRRP